MWSCLTCSQWLHQHCARMSCMRSKTACVRTLPLLTQHEKMKVFTEPVQSRSPTWNKLPENIVSAGTVNTFKNRLDKFWTTNPPSTTAY
ncbi:hypothetical protein FHG87_009298 [Trinorchestia longiramus]|nr:hypothetical protein FHG87_009298 [Trinorchestia longiramus]